MGKWLQRWMRHWRFLPLCSLLALLLVGAAVSTRSPTEMVLAHGYAPPSLALPLGRGEGGIDLFAALMHAMGRGLVLALAVSALGFVVGTPLGALAGYRKGLLGSSVARLCDLVQSFPSFLLALAVVAVVPDPSRMHLAIVFGVAAWAPFARLAQMQGQTLASQPFVEASKALGGSSSRLVLRHILPNTLGPVSVQLGTSAAAVVIGETALGFLGLGPQDGVSLGSLLEQASLAMLRAPHLLLFTGCAVALTSGSLQLASEGLRLRLSLGSGGRGLGASIGVLGACASSRGVQPSGPHVATTSASPHR